MTSASRGLSRERAVDLATKGSSVLTVTDGVSLADAAMMMRDNGIGSLIVSNDGQHIDGIVSERGRRVGARQTRSIGAGPTGVVGDVDRCRHLSCR